MSSIKIIRESMGLTQVAFAKVLKITQGALSALETGRKPPSIKMMKKLMVLAKKKKLDITYEDLIGE